MAPSIQTESILSSGIAEEFDLATNRQRYAVQRLIDSTVSITFELGKVRAQEFPQLDVSRIDFVRDFKNNSTPIQIPNLSDLSTKSPEGAAFGDTAIYGSFVMRGGSNKIGYPEKRFENFPFLPAAIVELIHAAPHSVPAELITSFPLERMEDGVLFIKKHDSLGADEENAVNDLIRILGLKIRRAVPYNEQPFVTQAADGSLALDLTTKSGRLLAAFAGENTWNSRFIPNRGAPKKLRVLTTEELATTLEQLLAGFA